MWGDAVVAGLAITIVLVAVALRQSSHWRLSVLLSLAFVPGAFASDRPFTNNVTFRKDA